MVNDGIKAFKFYWKVSIKQCLINNFAILIPPLGMFLQLGIGGPFWLNILLTIMGYILAGYPSGLYHREKIFNQFK